MTALPGRWALTMSTPIGKIEAELAFTETGPSSAIAGTATGRGETVALRDIRSTVEGDLERVTWQQSITKPMRLNLDFDVTVDGDVMRGHSRAGRLPKSTVTGRRLGD
jgi:hypothetical protein